jgi:hypothetical protein
MSVTNGLADLGPPIALENPYTRFEEASGKEPKPAVNYGTNPPNTRPNGPEGDVNQGLPNRPKHRLADAMDRFIMPEKNQDGMLPSAENRKTKPPNTPPDNSPKGSGP